MVSLQESDAIVARWHLRCKGIHERIPPSEIPILRHSEGIKGQQSDESSGEDQDEKADDGVDDDDDDDDDDMDIGSSEDDQNDEDEAPQRRKRGHGCSNRVSIYVSQNSKAYTHSYSNYMFR